MNISDTTTRNCYQRNISLQANWKSILVICCLFLSSAVFGQTYIMNSATGPIITTCSGKFLGSGQGYAVAYGNNQNFVRTFKSGQPGKQLKFTFKVAAGVGVGIEPGDVLKVYDGLTTGAPLITQISSTTAGGHAYDFNVMSTSGALTFRFISDNQVTPIAKGWEANITCTDAYIAPPCAANPVNSAAADFCINAPTICNLDGYCGNTSSGYSVDTPDNMVDVTTSTTPVFNGVVDNNSWVKFIASEDTAQLIVTSSNCVGGGGNGNTPPGISGLQFQIFEGTSCTNFTAVSDLISQDGYKNHADLITAGSKSSKTGTVYNKLIPGQSYYVMVDGAYGAQCDYTINALTGVKIATISAPTSMCAGDSVKLIVDAPSHLTPTYTWSPGTGLNTTSGAIVTAKPATTTTYTVKITNSACGSVQTLQTTVTVNALPVLTANGVNPKCNGNSDGSITVQSVGSDAPYTYSINGVTFQSSNIFNNLAAKTYTINVKSAQGCPSQQTVTLTQPNILAVTTAATTSTCGKANGTASATPTGGTVTTGYIYSWNTTPVKTTASINNLPAGNYIVTVTDNNGCTKQQNAIVTNTDGPTAQATVASQVSCKNGVNGKATVNPSGGQPPYTYSWNTTPVQTSNTAINLPAGTYIATVKDANNCESVVSVTITQPSQILTSFDNAVDIKCFGDLTGSAIITATGGTKSPAPNEYSYIWTNANGAVLPITGKNATNLGAGKYICTVTDANGCSVIDSVTINQPTNIVLKKGTILDVKCFGDATGTATITATGGTVKKDYTYEWSTVPKQTTATATDLKKGTYTVIIKDNNGCSKQSVFDIKQPNNALSSTTKGTAILCNAAYTGAASVIVIGGTPKYTYEWENNTSTTANITGVNAGTYYVTITDANFCKTKDSVTITEPKDSITATIINTKAICNKDNGSATVSVNGGTPDYTYEWSNSNSTDVNATNLEPGSYTLTITDKNGCTLLKTSKIDASPAPIATISNIVNVLCFGDSSGSARVTVKDGKPAYTYLWTPINKTTSAVTKLKGGNYTVTITDKDGCTDVKTIAITTPEAPEEKGNITGNYCEGDSAITLYAPEGNAPFQWYLNGQKIAGANQKSISIRNTNAKGYTVTYYIQECMHKSSNVIATIPASYFIPDNTANVFTPNGDAVNATFHPYASTAQTETIEYYAKEFSLKVFDRWGKQVYETNAYNPSWDGNYEGKPAKEGVYYWMASYVSRCGNDNKKIEHKGFVHLLR